MIKDDGKKKSMMFIPVRNGMIKVHIFGFHFPGSWGKVFAKLNGKEVSSVGTERKKTIIQCLSKLHSTLSS
ncbi:MULTISPECIES: hypothetical protein [unclassified Bacillus (in: firmicutes)]|uniref:hypothetical protein n=1 Tax=unclassified Bacillus (in: firmicutes) TaxID=185979 RepID=UPI0008EB531F|nr:MULTISPECIES: hypothetical protein [unclassified Bacillus (in: firmicutes)]SFA76780.1 hypothetical protein SAMN02799634_101619 [Bacillus sp. UNCCL13]SFQ66655.1 hypothetical protein SAMN04488577_0895 [Bacillus sp. cl95]